MARAEAEKVAKQSNQKELTDWVEARKGKGAWDPDAEGGRLSGGDARCDATGG